MATTSSSISTCGDSKESWRGPPGPRSRRLEGQLLPPATALVTVERPGEDGVSVQADELGRFSLDGLEAGVIRLHVVLRGVQIAVPWTTI